MTDTKKDESGSRGAAAFAFRDFRLYQIARALVIMGAEAQAVAVAWQVYLITHRAIDLGYTGLALFLPGLIFMLPAGHTADRFDRRVVILVCYSLQTVCTFTLFLFAFHGLRHILPIYTILFFIGTGRAFSGPASSALVPHLVPAEHFVNAVTWGATVFQIANIAGPAIGGLLFTLPLAHWGMPRLSGAALVFLFTLFTLAGFLTLIGMLSVRPGRMEHRSTTFDLLLEGLRYVWRAKLLLGSVSLDLFVVLLGGAVALMPIFAENILHTGARGLGILRAAPAAGALTVSILLSFRPIRQRAGRLMFICVGIFGVATVVFGLSRTLWLSLIALVILGAADMVSVVIRSSLLQLATPPSMRGRVSAVNSLFVGASNELGEYESGLTAQWWGPVRAVVLGGIGSLMVTGLWTVLFPALRNADALTAASLMQPEEQLEQPSI
ncbi:MAG TPA: MFS transporter [Acidobacteriaceae bacterium]